MDVFPKYIIEDGILIIAKCTYHYQLMQNVNDKSRMQGGGWWRMSDDKTTITFTGDSHDFGKASLESVQTCFEAGNVFTDIYELRNIINDYTFYYDLGSEKVLLSSFIPSTKTIPKTNSI